MIPNVFPYFDADAAFVFTDPPVTYRSAMSLPSFRRPRIASIGYMLVFVSRRVSR